jgi:hypothetical protein
MIVYETKRQSRAECSVVFYRFLEKYLEVSGKVLILAPR